MTDPGSRIEATFYVWVTAVSDAYTEQLVGRLCRRGWRVGALGNVLSLRNEDNLATVVALSITKLVTDDKPDSQLTEAKALSEVQDVLKRLNVRYYSIVLARPCGCTWMMGNCSKEALQKAEEELKKKVN